MSFTAREDKPAGVSEKPQRHSPIFLVVFAVFLVATAICVAGTVVGVLSAHPSHHDTQWFWASGHLLTHGGNPYDRHALRGIETSLGLRLESNVPMNLNPPNSLFLLIPIGILGPRLGVVVWSLLMFAFLLLSIWAIRAMLKVPYERALVWLAWCFAPALCCIEMGQTGLIILLGLTLFLRFHERIPFWAGAALTLCAVKPHLLLPFGVVLIAWVVARRRWAVVAGAAGFLAVEGLIAMLLDQSVWIQYRAMIRTEPFVGYFVPTIGEALRFAVNRTAMWIEFIPAALGCIWGLWYFWRNRETWNWLTHGSLLALVSLVVAPYSWFTDQVLALPAIFFVLMGEREPRRGSLTLLLAVMSAAALEMMKLDSYSKVYIVQCLAWLGWYLYATSGRTPEREVLTAGVRDGNAVSA